MKARDYAQALYESLKGVEGTERDRRFQNFILLLERRSHRELLPHILSFFKKIYESDVRSRTVEVSSARALTNTERDEILRHTRFKSIFSVPGRMVRYTVDETLIGGIRVKSRDILADGSYKTKLLNLYETLTGAGTIR